MIDRNVMHAMLSPTPCHGHIISRSTSANIITNAEGCIKHATFDTKRHRIENNFLQPPKMGGICGRLLYALNPTLQCLRVSNVLARCHPYILLHLVSMAAMMLGQLFNNKIMIKDSACTIKIPAVI